MSRNLLKNGGFEADWAEEESHRCLFFPEDGDPYEKDVGNIFTPSNWLTWLRHEPDTWDQPEIRDAWKSGDPRRVHGGEKGMLLFTFYRKHDAGFLQQVQVEPGDPLRLTAWAHAWSNWQAGQHPDDPGWSDGEGVGYDSFFALEGDVTDDNARNFFFSVGIDPTGGTDPFAGTVVWGKAAHIYNEYAQVPEVTATAQANTVTVFLRSKTLWPFKHNDAYWDDAELVVVGEPEKPEKPEEPEPVEWDYSVIEKGSKLGVHSIFSNRVGDFTQDLVDGGACFPVVKAVDDLGWLVGIKETSPETITIGRLTQPVDMCGGVEKPSFDMEKYAKSQIDAILDKMKSDRRLEDAIDYWEVYNEPDPPTVDGHRRLAELMIITMALAEKHGLKVVIFTFCAGCPEWDEMEAVVETGVFARAKRGGHILALHEGVFGRDPVDKWWGDPIPGAPHVEGAGALCFRYRYLYHLLEQRNEVVPLIISEIVFGGGYERGGQTTADVVKRVRWYDEEARKDYYHLAFLPFTLGPVGEWYKQDYEFAYPALVEYMISVKDQQNAMLEEPAPEPEEPEEPEEEKPCRGAPREQYARTYVLLPPDADSDWARAVVGATWDDRHFTIGSSADDAGIGDLDSRTVIAVNPSHWPSGLEEFFETYYPGVHYVAVKAATPEQLVKRLRNL